MQFSLSVVERFLCIAFRSAHFSCSEKFPVSMKVLRFLYENSENMSQFSIISFVGTPDFWAAFEVP